MPHRANKDQQRLTGFPCSTLCNSLRFPLNIASLSMGNSSSSSSRSHHDETVDCGALVPQGVYSGPQDWNQSIVSQLIISRRLAPFYRPLEDYEDSWDDEQILAARKELPDSDHSESVTRTDHSHTLSSTRYKRPGSLKEPARPEAQVYRGAIECPICFLVSRFADILRIFLLTHLQVLPT